MRASPRLGSPTRSSGWFESVAVDECLQDLTDGSFSADGFWQGQVGLDLVAVAAAVGVFVLDHIAGGGQVGDDRIGPALGDVHGGGDVAQAHPGIVGDAD